MGAHRIGLGHQHGPHLDPSSGPPHHPDTLWTLSSLGVYRSINGGDNWIRTITGNSLLWKLTPPTLRTLAGWCSATTLPRALMRAPPGKSTAWMALRLASAASPWPLRPQAPDTVYAVAGKNNDQGFAGFWRSTDGGAAGRPHARRRRPQLVGLDGGWERLGGQAWYDLALAVHPQDPTAFTSVASTSGASEDGGPMAMCAHWYAGGELPYLHADQHG